MTTKRGSSKSSRTPFPPDLGSGEALVSALPGPPGGSSRDPYLGLSPARPRERAGCGWAGESTCSHAPCPGPSPGAPPLVLEPSSRAPFPSTLLTVLVHLPREPSASSRRLYILPIHPAPREPNSQGTLPHPPEHPAQPAPPPPSPRTLLGPLRGTPLPAIPPRTLLRQHSPCAPRSQRTLQTAHPTLAPSSRRRHLRHPDPRDPSLRTSPHASSPAPSRATRV